MHFETAVEKTDESNFFFYNSSINSFKSNIPQLLHCQGAALLTWHLLRFIE